MKFVVALLVGLTAAALFVELEAAEKKKMICYYGSWAVYRPGNGKFDVENIDPFVCTHIIFGFAALNTDSTIKSYDPYNDLYENWGKGAYLRFTGLKKQNPELKALIAIGGWNEGSIKYSQMVSDPALRAKFVSSVVSFIKTYDFDGLDLDWEYPANRGGVPSDKPNFVKLCRELKAAFAPYGWLLTAAVSPGKDTIDSAYDIASLSSILDQIHIMGYDYHGAWEANTGLNAPLYGNPNLDIGDKKYFNVNFTVNYYISNGASPSKLILGMPLYGRGFTLASSSQNGINAYAPQPITAGPYTRENGIWGYNEICEKFSPDAATAGWTVVRDSYYQTPYAYKGNQWIGYDDAQSLTLKAQYAAAMNLGGAMVWSMETDDFRGLFGPKFNLIKTIYQAVSGTTPPDSSTAAPARTTTTAPATTTTAAPVTSTTTVAPVTTTTTARPSTTTAAPATSTTTPALTSSSTAAPLTSTTTSAPASTTTATSTTFTCTSSGYFRNPNDCGSFYQCASKSSTSWTLYTMKCATGLAFSEKYVTCTYPRNVPECASYTG